jgi:hypothetical protein
MAHPCDGHPCDHCYTCDVLGVCCATVSPGQPRQSEAQARSKRLHEAIILEARTVPGLTDLIRRDAERERPPKLLPMSSPLGLPNANAEHIPTDSRKEAIYVHAPCTAR